MTEWKEYKFSDFVNLNPTISLGKDQIYSFVEMKDLVNGQRYCEPSQERKLSGGTRFQNKDTLFARITPCLENGKICQVRNLKNDVGFGSTEFHVFRGKEGVSDTDFIFYLSRWDEVRNYAEINLHGTSGRQRVPKEAFNNLELLLPPLPEQKAIAETLSSLDDKIDLLHRQNKTLEQMAETLFRQWFVEEAKEDWEDGTLNDIVNFNPIYRISKNASVPYLEMKNVSTSTFNPEGWYYRDFTSGMKFQNGDTIIARITPCLENGKTSFITFLEEKQIGWGSTEYIVMRMKKPYHKFISYLIAKDTDFREFAISSMSGSSGRQRAQADIIKEYEIKIPSPNVIEKLNIQLEPIVEKLKYNAIQIPILEKMRDTLLPKLMSGVVTISV